jgi:HAD superfamily hydrolase (TIGR01450 family)
MENKKILKKIKCFVFDMDGTVYNGENLFEGAYNLFKYFEEHEIKYYFLTNNSSKTGHVYAEKLVRLGVPFIRENHVITSGDITIEYLRKNNFNKIFLVGTPEYKNQCIEAGLKIVENKFEKIDAVVVSFDTTFNYSKGEIATHYLRKGIPFLATNEDLVCPIENNQFIPDCGSITSLIETASNRDPKYLGKPRKETVEYLLNYVDVDKDELAIVGDRLYTDIATGFYNNFTSIAVLSGEFTMSDLKDSVIKPTLIFTNINELYNSIKSLYIG